MAGRIQFNREEAVEAAVQVFWRKGFMATSMDDIKKATGVNESSLYNTFGNKEGLYKEALARYRKMVMTRFASLPNLEQPRETLRTSLLAMAQLATTEEGAAGCMLMNSAMELGAQYQDIADYARESYALIEEWLYETVKRGQELGEISKDRKPRALARYLSFNIQGMFAVARTSPTEEFMKDVAETLISAL
jgi:TetR/AcrR family transcriptional repressor of nem operon